MRDKMLDPPSKATTQKIASGDKVTRISGHATTAGQTIVVEPDGSSRAGKRKYPKDSSCVISRVSTKLIIMYLGKFVAGRFLI